MHNLRITLGKERRMNGLLSLFFKTGLEKKNTAVWVKERFGGRGPEGWVREQSEP